MTQAVSPLQEEIQRELTQYPVLVYSKGTRDIPRCGFTIETREFFDQLGVEAMFIDVLDNPEKRQELAAMTNWPTLPKVFIHGKFYGDTDILGPMAESGELQKVLGDAAGQ